MSREISLILTPLRYSSTNTHNTPTCPAEEGVNERAPVSGSMTIPFADESGVLAEKPEE